jgi:peptidoglycan/LPS O-acetylase OafA/YrhL
MMMLKFLPPRLRMPVQMLAVGAVGTVFGVIAWGWAATVTILPFTLLVAAWYYVLGGRESDMSALVLGRGDERQEYRQLRMQALMGQVMSLAVGVTFIIAVATKTTTWPFAVLVPLPILTLVAGGLIYREHPGGREQQIGH